jgi:CheY-like chemotaxis protein
MALLEAEPYRLLICDLKMPKMDGLQVLSIVRRRFPELRTVVMTGVEDEEFRSRAYALGVDLFWLKPDTHQNMQMFLECIESLLGRDAQSGFRGIQNKSLMDILQMECLSQSSTVFRITRGSLVGKIWILNGDLIDAETEGARGEVAFRRILEWKSGTFETLPSEPERERTIVKSINALLLEAAQAIDETGDPGTGEPSEEADHRKTVWRLATLTREGGEWVVSVPNDATGAPEGWGTQSANEFAAWTRFATESIKRLGEKIEAGPWSHIQAQNLEPSSWPGRPRRIRPASLKNPKNSFPHGTPEPICQITPCPSAPSLRQLDGGSRRTNRDHDCRLVLPGRNARGNRR